MVVTEDDQTWTFGGNQYGQLGHGDKNHRPIPVAVPGFQGAGVVSVACGVYHTVGGVDEPGDANGAFGRMGSRCYT